MLSFKPVNFDKVAGKNLVCEEVFLFFYEKN